MRLTIATRQSPLAIWQSEFIAAQLGERGYEACLAGFKTTGDAILDSPLAKIGGKGLFTKELENAILKGEADLAVHSLKDLPTTLPPGLILAAVSERENPADVLVSESFKDLASLPEGARVGTSSLRRKMQLLMLRPDLKILPLRGNLQSRLEKLRSGTFEAIILARAGLARLGLLDKVGFVVEFSLDELIPAAGQGVLGIECAKGGEVQNILAELNEPRAWLETLIERDFVDTLEAGCSAPIGINAKSEGDEIIIRAVLGLCDGSEFLREKIHISPGQAEGAGRRLAEDFIARGALELLRRAEEMS